MAGLEVTYDAEQVLFLRPDVAAVKVRQRYLTPDGDPAGTESEGSPLYVMAEEDGHWRLAAGENTLVRPS
ncbi:SgcJ/EcaC family oxidoreductase [Saccharopolyspora rhizosphaerae]|uniref:SgcJ/EcaC family oxidoreductase n=1 Tax=Saccharopolyspora rhizosphaerae TaxID=2492662 RepID=UPI001F39FBB2|nr:SgcJ/EcaC family oxidoreductase [Saccharopolyspora rhizosphaerae]